MDLAAKDKRCTRFDADFRVELLFLPLQGQVGTGAALGAARDARRAQAEAAAGEGSGNPGQLLPASGFIVKGALNTL